ncbi:MAG TPA: DUF1294 domain-containing protein [Clostridia bacterium]|nr:DUF1294 domain-containing protein [Clostridia bacterium]
MIDHNIYLFTIIAVLAVLNLTGFILTASDKHKARRGLWRVPEKTFFLLALIGGSIGIYAGMLLFRHKTKHWYFMIGIPAIFVLQIILAFFLTGRFSHVILS